MSAINKCKNVELRVTRPCVGVKKGQAGNKKRASGPARRAGPLQRGMNSRWHTAEICWREREQKTAADAFALIIAEEKQEEAAM